MGVRIMVFPWSRRQVIGLHNLPDTTQESLRRLSHSDLCQFIADWAPGTANWIAGDAELKRRLNWPSRWAFFISVASLIVSILAFVS